MHCGYTSVSLPCIESLALHQIRESAWGKYVIYFRDLSNVVFYDGF